MAKEKLVKRTFRVNVIVNGATKEFSEGMGVGVLGYQEVTFNLPAEKYNGPMFEISLVDQAQSIALSFLKTEISEVK